MKLLNDIVLKKMADAMEMMILSILAPALHCDWLLNEWEKALITTVCFNELLNMCVCDLVDSFLMMKFKVVFCGMMLSGTIWGKLCDTYGRRSVKLEAKLTK